MKMMKMKIYLMMFIATIISLSFITNISALDNDDIYSCPMGGAAYSLNGGYGAGPMILTWTISILFMILIVAGFYWFFKTANKK